MLRAAKKLVLILIKCKFLHPNPLNLPLDNIGIKTILPKATHFIEPQVYNVKAQTL